ncbi:MFS-type transporter SLC18B1-like isoform X1 [Strongylocentrotus purpuratus]|uniref:Major facilitator superfamily (MFS) profile domain-containing protein n=1 Tax=Strongylocentrotus purpuratus TaxID=7668 RepID=A0A7M7NZ91_STRPU|nr:MFS-type transporter SLC18B1-like isoform X1 [Strongylocentrotus purpuratus]
MQQNISHTMADEIIKLLSSKHDDKNSRYIQLQDLDHSHHSRSGPTDVVPTAPTSPSEITDAITSGQDGENGEKEKTNSSMTLAQKLTFVGMAIIYLASFMSFSVLAPFFPYEAEKKGVSPTETGLVFGIFALTSFIASPILGKYLPTIGGKFMFLSGSFVTSGCNILFGFLNKIEGKTTFLIYCFVIRIVEALGSAATNTAGLAICANVYPDKVAQMSGFLEVFVGIGLAIGPALGSLFYGIGGYQLPFLVIGLTAMAFTILNIFTLPSLKSVNKENTSTGSLQDVMKIPAVWVVFICCGWASTCIGFTEATLTLHLTSPPFNLSPSSTGLLFFVNSVIYGIFAPIAGYIADKKEKTRIMITVGMCLTGISLMLVGPSPLLHIQGQLWIMVISLVILGFGLAFAMIPTFLDMLFSASWYGLPDNLATQSLISGLFNSSFTLGYFLGPIGGGALVERIGFNWTSTFSACGCFITVLMISLFGAWEFKCGKGRRIPSHMNEQS